MFTLREITYVSILVRVLLAFVLGGLVGLERGMKNRPAGLRTYMLVCLGSCMVMMTNQYVMQVLGQGDPVRMGAQVVSGIGFLGAGTIIVTSRNQIKGLTTAAGLWAAACMGLAIGIGFYELAVLGGALIFLSLSVLHRMDNRMRRNTRMVEAYIELGAEASLGSFMRFTREKEIEISNLQMENDTGASEKSTAFIVTLRGKKPRTHAEIIRTMREMAGLGYIEEL